MVDMSGSNNWVVMVFGRQRRRTSYRPRCAFGHVASPPAIASGCIHSPAANDARLRGHFTKTRQVSKQTAKSPKASQSASLEGAQDERMAAAERASAHSNTCPIYRPLPWMCSVPFANMPVTCLQGSRTPGSHNLHTLPGCRCMQV